MQAVFISIIFTLVTATSFAQAQESVATSDETYNGGGWAERYCKQSDGAFWHYATCRQASRIAEGSALDKCYSDGNAVCSVKLVWVNELSGRCSDRTDYCAVRVVAVPYKVQSTQYVGDFENK